jgi:hypothetical protein
MRWEKLGQLFDPSLHTLAEGCTSFAKSPQALVFDEYVRIYFCAQKRTPNGKYLSCPQFVDFDKGFKNIINISTETVIKLGELGEFDEHGIFPINIIRHAEQIWAFTSGWSRRQSVSIDMGIGLATSIDNGKSFQKYGSGGPIMAATNHEPFLVGDPFVRCIDGIFHMWYIFGTKWVRPEMSKSPERFYKIAHATSADGTNWARDGKYIIENCITDECQALPTVFKFNDIYHMYFCFRNAYDFRENAHNSYRLGYAYSSDLINWQRDDTKCGINVSNQSWDSEMMCYPNVFECDGDIYMLYNGNEFGKYGFGLAKLIGV